MVSSSLYISLSLSIISILSAEKWYQYGLSEECHHTGAYPNSTALTNHHHIDQSIHNVTVPI